MASERKKTQTNRRKTSSRKKNSKKTQELTFESEIILWILLAVSILLFISNFGIGGKVGNAASSLIFGLFGFLAYIFPILLFVGACFIISNKNNHFAIFKFVACILLFFSLCMFAQLLIEKQGTESSEIIKNAYTYGAAFKKGGGALGGIFVWLCAPNFGTFGSFVISIAVMIISVVLITERSIFSGMKRGGQKMYESAKEDAIRYHDNQARRREAREAREEENEKQRQLKRMEKRVEGVAIDTVVCKPKRKRNDEISEITLEDIPLEDISSDSKPNVPEPAFAEPVFPEPVTEKIFASEPSNVFPGEEPLASGETSVPEYNDAAMLEELLADVAQMTEPAAEMQPESEFTMAAEFDVAEEFTAPTEFDAAEEFTAPTKFDATEVFSAKSQVKPVTENHSGADNTPQKAEKNTEEENAAIAKQMDAAVEEVQVKEYVFPPVKLLKSGGKKTMGDSKIHLMETANKLQQTLKNFGVNVTISNVSSGPSVTRYEIQPEMGVKVSKIVNLTDDIKLNLAAADIRMEAPIPGKAAIGIEIPNKETVPVMFRDLVESQEFQKNTSNIAFAAGKDIAGKVIVSDIAKMPHVLIAGATGSGKSVCINTIIMSILYKAHPDDVKLIMVDPKVVELSVYNGIPHLMIPVVTDPKKAAGALNWAVAEMDDRYKKFAEYGVREIKGYNAKVESIKDIPDENKPKKMPQIVIIVDELADLMMVASNEVETSICRLAQLARAAGIHLIIATQRPSVNVITGLIKANMPSRIAFAVTSGVDSRTILDMVGAEKLLGKGDMLFFPQNYQKPLRVQGAFVSDDEVSAVVDFIKNENGGANYSAHIQESVEQSQNISMSISDGGGNNGDDRDVLFTEVGKFLIESEKGSIGSIQRKFKVGFNRAARIMDQLEEAGLVGPEEGTKPRKILMSPEEFEQYIEEYV